MQRNAYETVALVHRLLAWTFALVGLIFLVAPNGTVRFINAAGSVFRIFPPAPESDLRFWLSLGFAYMVLVAVLAWRIAADPRRNRALMPVLAAGKFASSFTCLLFFLFAQPTFLYLLNFIVDGSIVLIVLGCYLWLGVAEQAAQPLAQPQGRVAELLRLLTSTMVPEGGAFSPGAASVQLDQTVWQYFGRLHPLGTTGLTVILYIIEFGPYLFGPRRRRFSRLSAKERETYLAGWERGHFSARRQLLNGLKLAVMLHFYDRPDVAAAVGFDGAYLRDKLLAGPNAEFHRARLAL
ncbi:MAG TPA: hypothetical protein VMW56_05635 [Candidatus Margulisiibacteriota bacterium]|nr:hypothetical protein [Candidatus Margulisiibacteriota bacterium]